MKRRMTQDEVFLHAILEETRRGYPAARPPGDTALLVYADWLEERGDPRGEYIHLQRALCELDSRTPQYKELEARQRELRPQIESMEFTFLGKRVAGKLWFSLVLGEAISGVVTRIEDHGFYVDLGGIDGLVHIMDMSW